MARPRINCALDDDRSEPARQIIGEMRGNMVAVAEEQPLPDRFSAVPCPKGPAMIICDEETGRSTRVGLYAYRATREALADLFGG
ncbi:hypothetical protein vBEliSR6L_60 [Erythrobacter phage vB_EliS_R6L]|nr:hypothetical protein vBEliSR6L_60 [Erythrobacter phage vB_EliS_R6L]